MTEPYFVEIRVNYTDNDISPVGFGEMLSHEDCLGCAAIFWTSVFERIGEVEGDATCSKELPKLYQALLTTSNSLPRILYLTKEQTEKEMAGL